MKLFLKFIFLLFKGIPISIARFFYSWRCFEHIELLRRIRLEENKVYLIGSESNISISHLHLFFPRVHFLIYLLEAGSFEEFDGNLFWSTIHKGKTLKVKIFSNDDIWVLNEIFIDKCYDVSLPPETIVIDAGMNHGIASLMFACDNNVKAVHSFELMPTTYEKALYNGVNNHTFSGKISMNNIALGKEDRIIRIPKSSKESILSNIHFNGDVSEDFWSVGLKSASNALQKIFDLNEGHYFILKMDIEGAELDVLSDLAKSSLIRRISYITMEYHDGLLNDLKLFFIQYNFLFRVVGNENQGIIYAYNLSK